jgi:serpin B
VANSLWVQRGFPILPSFRQACQKHYEAEVDAVDFVEDREGAAQRINGWVKEKTKGLIPKLFEPADFDEKTRLAVVNTLYFKGKWQTPFQKERTREEEFHLSNGTTKRVPMMHQGGVFQYLKGEGFQAVALPYGKGDLSMYLFLPDKGRSVEEFVKSLTPARWQEWLKRFERTRVHVGLPRFRVETTAKLESPLKELGMTDAFDRSRADFRGIAPEPLYIHKALQKAVVEVNEEGTEAAAATGILAGPTSVPPSLIADRPFFFAIRHNATGVLLFMGIVAEL